MKQTLQYVCGITCLSLSSLTHAQTDNLADELLILDDYHVYASTLVDSSILPTKLPINSVYGSSISIMNTPRNVTVISREQLDTISIKDPRDFSKLTSSSYTGSNFGAPTTPSIRGQIADTLINGMRKGLSHNGNGLPINFNSVESVNILKGPPSVMVGSSQYVGGYVDLITKKPRFTDNEGHFTLTVDSEGLQKAELDQNWALSDQWAFRFSLTGENTNDYYWDNYYRQTTAIYAAATWIPNDHYRLELSGEYFNANYTENFGLNRPTKALLEHDTYVTGIGSIGGFADIVPTTGTTSISRKKRLHGEGDDSNGKYLSLQAVQTLNPNGDWTLVNNTLFQYRDRDTYSSYSYSEVMRDNFRIENRTEVRTVLNILGKLHSLNFGLSLSYQDVTGINDFYHEPANSWDLANQSYADIGVTDAEVFLDPTVTNFLNAVPIYSESPRGKLSYRPGSTSSSYYFPGIDVFVLGNGGDSNESQAFNTGLFLQDQLTVSDRLSLLFGYRVDFVHAESKDPQFDNLMRYLGGFYTPAELAATGVTRAEDEHSSFLPNFNLGLVYKLSDQVNFYANYNYSESIPVGIGGGVALEDDGLLNEDAFHAESELAEVGIKASMLDDTLFYTASIFHQTRVEAQSQGDPLDITACGFETELHYQPSNQLHLIAGYSYIDSTTENGIVATQASIGAVPSIGGEHLLSSFPSFSGYETDTAATPKNIINGIIVYKFTDAISGSLGLLVTSPMNLGYNVPGSATSNGEPITSEEIGWQYSIDLGCMYETDRWALSLKVLNLTDEKNWGAVNPIYGNDSVYAELPRRFELSASLKW